ncbi:hypothetical protein OKC48_21980 [Methylorubrum extorquens]|uniref:hypothetical protein n=1 Tax=Methylorubrum extorquens TaxID=408 RepID=UPI002236F4D2|nr:hypothetical protein [Methylorubrum extorquens]UYW25913.1 hypothetical protein OKC48_21980 [Methylorubrum extorquens]
MNETAERSAAELRGLLRFAQGLGLDEATAREIYEAVGREAAAVTDHDPASSASMRRK